MPFISVKMLVMKKPSVPLVPSADHVDLYDQMDRLPFGRLTARFKRYPARARMGQQHIL